MDQKMDNLKTPEGKQLALRNAPKGRIVNTRYHKPSETLIILVESPTKDRMGYSSDDMGETWVLNWKNGEMVTDG
jgi:hypothetical protein